MTDYLIRRPVNVDIVIFIEVPPSTGVEEDAWHQGLVGEEVVPSVAVASSIRQIVYRECGDNPRHRSKVVSCVNPHLDKKLPGGTGRTRSVSRKNTTASWGGFSAGCQSW